MNPERNPSEGTRSLVTCSTSSKSSSLLSEFLVAPPVPFLCTLSAPEFTPSFAFLILEAARWDGLEIDRLLLGELALGPFGDGGVLSLFSDRFLDALTLSLSRASRSRPGVCLDLLLVSLQEPPTSLLLMLSGGLLSCGCGGFLLGFLRICGLPGVAGADSLGTAPLCTSLPLDLSIECRPLQPWREQQLLALEREASSLKRRIDPPLVKRRPPTVRLPMCSSMSDDHLKSEMVGK